MEKRRLHHRNTPKWGRLIEGVLFGRRTLNRIITVLTPTPKPSLYKMVTIRLFWSFSKKRKAPTERQSLVTRKKLLNDDLSAFVKRIKLNGLPFFYEADTDRLRKLHDPH